MYRFLSISFFLLFSCAVQAQFKGLESYRWDAAWQKILHKAKVKSVKEFTAGKTDYQTGYCSFDKQGRLLDQSFIDIRGDVQRRTYAYNKKNQVIKVISYDRRDTTKVISIEEFKFSKSGKTSYTLSTKFIEGKIIQDSTLETILNTSKTLTVKESTYKKDGTVYRTTTQKDSLNAKCSFRSETSIEYYNHPPKESRQQGWDSLFSNENKEVEIQNISINKHIFQTILWYCDPKDISYSLQIRSSISNMDKHESVYIQINYIKHDDKNHFIEIGEMFYDEFPSNQSTSSYKSVSPDLIKKLLNGNLKGREQMLVNRIYKADLLIEENIAGTKKEYSYRHNDKGLITEINCISSYKGAQSSSKITKYVYEYH